MNKEYKEKFLKTGLEGFLGSSDISSDTTVRECKLNCVKLQ